jgi:hypothetical protein
MRYGYLVLALMVIIFGMVAIYPALVAARDTLQNVGL